MDTRSRISMRKADDGCRERGGGHRSAKKKEEVEGQRKTSKVERRKPHEASSISRSSSALAA